MIHPRSTRSEDRANVSQCRTAGTTPEAQPRPIRYVFLPHGLISAFAHDPLAVGIYVAIARLAMAAKGAVPLAARDLVIWMGSDQESDRAAIMRRIVKLEQHGWISITRSATAKHRLLPTWGRDHSGALRPWCFEQNDCGRPQHLRGRRMPITLFDDYLGRLEPQPGQGRALISRYLTRPLLDLTDIGVYAIGLHVEIAPTPRLKHLWLWSSAGIAAVPDTTSLLTQVAAGTVSTIEHGDIVQVGLSVHGYARLGITAPMGIMQGELAECRPGRSLDGSVAGSRRPHAEVAGCAHQNGLNCEAALPTDLIAWDVGMSHELTKHDSAANQTSREGGMITRSSKDSIPQELLDSLCKSVERTADDSLSASENFQSSIDQAVITGHHMLNVHRPILAGEWAEVFAMQQAYGVEQVLIWQARASRADVVRPFGITPAYYRACGIQTTRTAEHSRPTTNSTKSAHRDTPKREQHTSTQLDPECEALLRAMGVREWRKLEGVPPALIAAWSEAITHPGIAARFDSPIGFAVKQMRQGQTPPPLAELNRWAERATQRADRYDTWRHLNTAVYSQEQISNEQQLEARVRAIAPPEADVSILCLLADWLEHGVDEAEALARLATFDNRGAR